MRPAIHQYGYLHNDGKSRRRRHIRREKVMDRRAVRRDGRISVAAYLEDVEVEQEMAEQEAITSVDMEVKNFYDEMNDLQREFFNSQYEKFMRLSDAAAREVQLIRCME